MYSLNLPCSVRVMDCSSFSSSSISVSVRVGIMLARDMMDDFLLYSNSNES